jgi:alkylation response protein AidB-like acyl-CoA dehydrogenase
VRFTTTTDATAGIEALLDDAHPHKIAASRWAAEHLGDRNDGFDRARWRQAAEYGVLGLRTPAELGGSGASIVDTLLTFEGLGHGCPDSGFVFALASQVFAMQTALVGSGSPDQHATWLPRLCAGDAIGAFAMSEPAAGSDTAAITTTVAIGDDEIVIDGTKAWVTLGPVCDVVIVFATTDPALGRWGLTAVLVPIETPGVSVGPVEAKAGLKSCPFGTLTFDRCTLPRAAVLGAPGAGGAIFAQAVEAERAFLYGAQLGVMARTLERTIARAQQRTQFGRRIGEFQAVSHRIAEMKLRYEIARLLVYKAAILADRGESVTMAAALAKLHTSEAAVASALDAVRIHGAEGYTEAAGIEIELRDAVGGLAYSGTSEIQRNVVAGLLGVDRPPRPTTTGR